MERRDGRSALAAVCLPETSEERLRRVELKLKPCLFISWEMSWRPIGKSLGSKAARMTIQDDASASDVGAKVPQNCAKTGKMDAKTPQDGAEMAPTRAMYVPRRTRRRPKCLKKTS